MGGTLTSTSALGQGSTFSVELPRVEGPVERYERLRPEPVPAVTVPTHGAADVAGATRCSTSRTTSRTSA